MIHARATRRSPDHRTPEVFLDEHDQHYAGTGAPVGQDDPPGRRGAGVGAAGVDLLAAAGEDGLLWQHEGFGLAGRGVALRIDLPRGLSDAAAVAGVAGTLAAIGRGGDEVAGPGTGAVALGALPFVPAAAGALVVPRVLLGRRDGEAWITTVTGPDDGPAAARLVAEMTADALGGAAGPRPGPSEFTLTSVMDHEAWGALVAGAVARIGDGALGKVVLARQVDVRANRPFVTSDVVSRLLALYPMCMVFRIDGFLGASPELLIERRGAHVASHPLAGTIGRSGDLATDEALIAGLLASPKDRREHAYVIEGLRRTLGPLCDDLDVPAKPTVLELRNVSHLASRLTGVLSAAPGGPAGRAAGRGTPGTGRIRACACPVPCSSWRRCIPRRRSAGRPPRRPWPISARSRASTAAGTPGRWAGWTPAVTEAGPSGSGQPTSTATTPRCTPAPAWSPDPGPPPSWPKPSSNCRPCWPPSSGPEVRGSQQRRYRPAWGGMFSATVQEARDARSRPMGGGRPRQRRHDEQRHRA